MKSPNPLHFSDEKLPQIFVCCSKAHLKIQKQFCVVVFEENFVAAYLVYSTVESKVRQFKASQKDMELSAFLFCDKLT
jgi:hypothetical protein